MISGSADNKVQQEGLFLELVEDRRTRAPSRGESTGPKHDKYCLARIGRGTWAL